MPGMDGFAVMEALKEQAQGSWLPVLVVTADPGHTLRALQAGARDFVAKPFDVVELKARIRNMLELRLLYRRLEDQNASLEQAVLERTAQLRDSEERYRSLTELACDWYWEQDENGKFTKMFGPVLEMLGLWGDSMAAQEDAARLMGWNEGERSVLRAAIAAREPFLDFVFSRTREDGTVQKYQVSGEPMFGPACSFLGYRGIGQEIVARPNALAPSDTRVPAPQKK
jgi:PAS domain S-box-containing protein